MDALSENIITIPESFSKRNIFLTGGSGFIGKVLIEKILRSCPDVGKVYVLLREKRGKSATERVNKMTSAPLFDVLKKQNVEAINKIVPLNGDISKIGLGLSEEDRNIVINTVSIVFHVGASVRFDEPLKTAVLQNVRGTREVIYLAEETKNLAVFVHVSTVYANCDKRIIEEKIYPPHVDWREMIQVAEETDEYVLEILTQKCIRPLPNTYTFSKSLAEHVVYDMCKEKIPTVIMRPSIVVSSLSEPVPGWIDNFNGPFSLFVVYGTGIARIMYGAKTHIMDHVTVDNFVKALVIAAWRKTVEQENKKEVTIYNCCSDIRCSMEVYREVGFNTLQKIPFDKKIWVPKTNIPITKCRYNYFIHFVLYHLLPAIVVDGLLKLFGKQSMLLKIQRKMYIANTTLTFFMTEDVDFKIENYVSLNKKLLNKDKGQFILGNVRKHLYAIDLMWGIKKYLLNESPTISQRTWRIEQGLRVLDKVLNYVWYMLVIYIVYCNHHIFLNILERLLMK